MSRTALILAAHGSRVDPTIDAQITGYAARIARLGLFDHVAKAFHHGEPTFATVLDQLDADEVTVVPVMTSDGYYCDEVLPRELPKNRRFAEVHLRQTPPVGAHPGMISLVERRARRLIRDHNLAGEDVCVAVVGHGTPRHPRSRLETVRLADALRRIEFCGQVLYAFLEEEPSVESILERAAGFSPRGHGSAWATSAVIVIPFLISSGPHAAVDIPSRLGLQATPGTTPPFHGPVGDRLVVCDAAIGTHPEIVDVIVDLATSTQFIEVQNTGWHGQAPAWPCCFPLDRAPAHREHTTPVEAPL